jgi:hypothetical protein
LIPHPSKDITGTRETLFLLDNRRYYRYLIHRLEVLSQSLLTLWEGIMPRLTTLALGFITAILCGSLFAATDSQLAMHSLNKMPLAFTQNNGQWDDRVLFRANAGGATMWFTKDGVTYQFTRRIGDDANTFSSHSSERDC